MATDRPIHTMARCVHAICAGELPWVALGNFLNEWFAYSYDQREMLVAEPIQLPSSLNPHCWRWAVFCAASVEWLCAQSGIRCPAWPLDPVYTLAEPWYGFDAPGAHKSEVRAHLLRFTPEPFARRNIYCGNRMFANKYEFAVRRRGTP